MKEVEVNLELAREHGLTEEEYQKIQEILGRTPNFTELGIFSAMWSEHCSYKNSIHYLKKLPTTGKRVLTKAGEENAGAIDIGDGLAVVFKVESHNHPSALEPYQGAATGVGGIMRDIFTMGARPIASLNSLRFGDPEKSNVRHLLRGVVKGIGDYGNCLGIPTVGGEIYFEDIYEANPLVNAMVVGIARHEEIAFSKAEGAGNTVMIVGSTTGRDGIHGASFASQDLSEESGENRSAVQVGDPFMEKLLLEATLELLKSNAVIGIQDMGAAGISCSTAEMSGKTGHGMKIDLDKVPIRETGMIPYEIMLSESQERMLVVVKKGMESLAAEIMKKWDLHAEVVGEVTTDGLLSVYSSEKLKAQIPSKSLILGGGAPVYIREGKKPQNQDDLNKMDLEKIINKNFNGKIPQAGEILAKMISSPNLCSRLPVYNQYDHQVGISTLEGPGCDAAIMRLHNFGTQKGLAVTIDCNGRYLSLDPEKGAMLTVAEAARNLACTGAEPLGVTNCLNFANPYIPENYWFFANAVTGMSSACRAFGIPITGGNVSFYNESPKGPVYPTPTIGMVGLLENSDAYASMKNARPGMELFLAGWFDPVFGGSEYLKYIHNAVGGMIPSVNLDQESSLQQFLIQGIREEIIPAAHDLSDGGLIVALSEMAFHAMLGISLDVTEITEKLLKDGLQARNPNPETLSHLVLFGETGASALVAVQNKEADSLAALAQKNKIPLYKIGTYRGDSNFDKKIQVSFTQGERKIDWVDMEFDELHQAWQNGLLEYFDITREKD